MARRNLSRYALSLVVAAFLSACGGSQSPIGALRAMPQNGNIGPSNSSRSLLYYWDFYYYDQDEYVGTYPNNKFIETVKPPYPQTGGLCTDILGDVFVADQDMVEYSHGGTEPIGDVAIPGESPSACAVDPLGGVVAVTSQYSESDTLYTFKPGQTHLKLYTESGFSLLYPGYDASADLFVEATDEYGNFRLLELPRHANRFKVLTLDQALVGPGSVQWDGDYMTVEDEAAHTIYRVTVKGSRAHVVGQTDLVDGCYGNQCSTSWIQGDRVLVMAVNYECSILCHTKLTELSYPRGSPIRSWGDDVEICCPVVSVGAADR